MRGLGEGQRQKCPQGEQTAMHRRLGAGNEQHKAAEEGQRCGDKRDGVDNRAHRNRHDAVAQPVDGRSEGTPSS